MGTTRLRVASDASTFSAGISRSVLYPWGNVTIPLLTYSALAGEIVSLRSENSLKGASFQWGNNSLRGKSGMPDKHGFVGVFGI